MTHPSAGIAVFLAALGLAFSAPTVGKAWNLVTPEENTRDNAAPRNAAPPDSHSGPTIHLVRPDISHRLTNPVTVEVQFGAGPGYAIDMQSFSATYGWLGINITRRLLEHSTMTANGLIAHEVELPPGDHRVTMSIADTSGRTSRRTFNLSVAR